jgi:transcription antitermination factor NusG
MSCLRSTTNEFIRANPRLVVDELSWFAVQTKPRFEKKAAAELQEKGISAFLPLRSEKRQWSDRRRVVELPMFPQYVFVRVAQSLNTRVLVLRTSGITNFVGMRGMGISIPDEQIESVRTVLAYGIPVSPRLFTNVGKRIRIRGGALDGLQGILTAVNGDQSLVVSVELIQRSLAIRITGFAIELV